MDDPRKSRQAFAALLDLPDGAIDLGHASLLIAREEYPDLDVHGYLERLDEMAREIRGRMKGTEGAKSQIAHLNRLLFEEMGFRGNREEYYDPRNSFLNDVLDRRIGIPITLAVLYVAIGERAGLPVRGVGMPGHFLVKYAPATSGEIFIDAFNGRTLTREECAKM